MRFAADRPILFSFRRCPYAIRARLSLAAAGLGAGTDIEVREVRLSAKPPELRQASPKATVPVLVLAEPDQEAGGAVVIDESLAIQRWALGVHDPGDELCAGDDPCAARARDVIDALIAQNDGPFKHHLDRFRYADRHPGTDAEEHRREALAILAGWNARLATDSWLLGDRPTLADRALLPFVRQFRLADPPGFDSEPGLGALQGWLRRFLEGPELAVVMGEAWAPRRPWRSPRWLYHLALAAEWRAAAAAGHGALYTRSTRGRALEDVGFLHASGADQIDGTFRRFYDDAGEVLLLTIDPHRLAAEVRWEPAPESGERFPHIYGPLPVAAVLAAEPYRPGEEGSPC